MRLWNNMHQVYLKSKDWKAKQFKVLGEIKTKFLLPGRYILLWDEVQTMVEIAILWFQIHITNALNTGNQYMVKSAENRMRSNLELLPVINVKSRPRYISALK
jgi:hypothetical protein